MEDDFFIFHTGNFLPFSIPYFHTKVSLDQKQRVICIVLFNVKRSLLLEAVAHEVKDQAVWCNASYLIFEAL